ncbi:glycoside hydrolase family protein [Membranihabitans marinus]|uniref:hypothetical protein n=1 Tax=Membranihabitans marinus TaxID=1227546 RepID=UPI001F28E926|nr:hypothetical protein [Membranihabitans marinus]
MKIGFLFLGFITLFSFVHLPLNDDIIVLNNTRELFVDDYLIDEKHKVDHHLCDPIPSEGGLKFDKPWEGVFVTYVSVIDNGQKFQMYYRGKGMVEGESTEVTCYAESNDGINWEKPNLGIHMVEGTTKNNVVMVNDERLSAHNFSVHYDDREGIPQEEKYKAVGGANHNNGSRIGLTRYVSPDGIHWTMYKDSSDLFPDYALDSHNVLTYLPAEDCFAIYLRTWTGAKPGLPYPPNGIRTIARSTSKDFVNWTTPELMEFGDTKIEHLYTNATQPYFRAPQILVSMPFRFSPKEKLLTDKQLIYNGTDESQWQGISDAIFMTSRGGNQYTRKFLESFVRPGASLQNWSARSNIPALGVIPTASNEMSMFVTRYYGSKDVALERLRLRTDGFASIKAYFDPGYMVTKPLKLEGTTLNINFETSTVGYVKVVVLDENGKEISGFGADDAVILRGDKIDGEVTWASGKTLADLKNKTVRLKFLMKDADMYSIAVQ